MSGEFFRGANGVPIKTILKEERREATEAAIVELGASSRVEWSNAGTVVIDGSIIYYVQARKAKRKGRGKLYGPYPNFKYFWKVWKLDEKDPSPRRE